MYSWTNQIGQQIQFFHWPVKLSSSPFFSEVTHFRVLGVLYWVKQNTGIHWETNAECKIVIKHAWVHSTQHTKAVRTCLFFVWSYVCCSFFLAHVKWQVTRSLMNSNYLTFINFHSWTDKHLPPLLGTSKCIRRRSTILKRNLKVNSCSLNSVHWYTREKLTSQSTRFCSYKSMLGYKVKQCKKKNQTSLSRWSEWLQSRISKAYKTNLKWACMKLIK